MKYIIISAPSGAGKTTIMRHLLKQNLRLEFSVSACSRHIRENETNAVDYYFISADEFRNKIRNNEFIEWQEVYKDHFYGTLKSEIERISINGNNAIFDVDVLGGMNLKKIFGKAALSIFIMPPSLEVLELRLKSRSADAPDKLAGRLEKAKYELSFAHRFDKIIINDRLDKTFKEAVNIVSAFL